MALKRADILERKEDILRWIEEGYTKVDISKELNCKPSTLNNYLKIMEIDYKGKPGYNENKDINYKSAWEYIENDIPIHSYRLKNKLIKEGIKKEQCECCNNSIWLDKPIPLELHHLNGNHFDNSLENLQILCPNCHALVTNKMIEENKALKKNYCIDCNKEISLKAIRCKSCSNKFHHKVNVNVKFEVDREELKKLIRTESFLAIGRKFQVTDNAIRKRCKKYNLPYSKREIEKYTDEEWELV